MAAEDTGLEAVASPMAGYLEKVQERASSFEICPWCSSKGLAHPLRSYHLNLEESVTLCTNPQCLFPLVSRPLEDVLASLVPVEPATEIKRKSDETSETLHSSGPSPKRPRLHEQESPSAPDDKNNFSESRNGQSKEQICLDTHALEHKDPNFGEDIVVAQDSSKPLSSDNQQVSFLQDCGLSEGRGYTSPVELDTDNSLPDGGDFSNSHPPMPEQTESIVISEPGLPNEEAESFQSAAEDMSCVEENSEDLIPAPADIFWKNMGNLCWLDSLLVALMNLKILKILKPKEEPQHSPIWTLLSVYDKALASIRSQQQTDKDGRLKIPNHVMHKINRDFEAHRMSVFNLLEPNLHCKLGQNESPVFALPLLVSKDCWLEPLFQSTFSWDFKCSKCNTSSKQNVVKILPTFTNIVPDWHPLGAVHFAPCNNCHRKRQRRKMVLQGVSPVFALHFVEGLPDTNVQDYSFNLNEKHYSITVIIQYKRQRKHFVTWAHRSDGSWVEFDDLEHPHCKTYKTLPVPAQEIHIVFWEEEEERRQESRACSPSTTFTESLPSINHIPHGATDLNAVGEELLRCAPDESRLNPQNGTDIMDTVSERDTMVMAKRDPSVSSTTLQKAFQGLPTNDIITLALVDLNQAAPTPNDSQMEQANKSKSLDSEDVKHGVIEDLLDPDSSSTLAAQGKSNEESSPMPEPEDKLSDAKPETTNVDDPRGKIASTVAASTFRSPVESESTPTTILKPPSPESSASMKVPQAPPTVKQQQKGWSQLLHRSLGHLQHSTAKSSLTQKLVSIEPSGHSTPTRQTNAAPRLVLRNEKGGASLKGAEMFGAFGSNNSRASPTLILNQTSTAQKPLFSNTKLNSMNTSRLASDKSSKLSEMLSSMSETEILRYKLLKKLKSKKKKLAKVDKMLSHQGDSSLRPDSTNMDSPSTVTSSTLDEEFFSDLLSPATTITSTLSPDSTDFLEMLASGQAVAFAEESNTTVQRSTMAGSDDLMDEFMAQDSAERPTEMEVEALSALELFL